MPTFGKTCIAQADTWVPLYTAGAGKAPTFNLNMVNCSAGVVTVGFAIGTAGVTNGDRLEFNTPLDPAGQISNVLERTGIQMSAGESIYVRASAANVVDARAYGYED
ncbi:hypothetical protein FNU76_23865 [Chitinimonas arctica]|uniref:Fimbrial protein n=1 Tax=Chitinimonas arctica TaxID=2594795 RepID=A0A516SLW5_9NEIS|nr:hypothetical protein [Chitinimonas arctica]QDQ27702.1 hypothetical protein FNU76_15835 [Chitinimonas arctica]QDQ29142.1 hypothetical protein FNU76_23865 [Chitinimonas arctica]